MIREIRYKFGQCWLGGILVATTNQGVCAILLGDNPHELLADLKSRFGNLGNIVAGSLEIENILSQVDTVVDSPAEPIPLRLHLLGTPFQRSVWSSLQSIPPGETVSYSEVARRIGRPNSVRAVARAIGANPIAVLIPCHRVVGKNGSLTGYRWGIERKKKLLNREQATEISKGF